MERNWKKIALGITTIAGAVTGVLVKDKTVRTISFGAAAVSGGLLVKDLFKKELKKVEEDCEETEKDIAESGLKPEKVESVSLMPEHSDEPVCFGEKILFEVYNSSIFSDEELRFDDKNYLSTLHVSQNTAKRRVRISIPLPNKGKLTAQNIRDYFNGFYSDFIGKNNICMKIYLDQVCYLVGRDLGDEGYIFYDEIEREENESFPEYRNRFTGIINAWERGGREKEELKSYLENTETIRFEQLLELEFPVFPDNSHKKGMDLVLVTKLLNSMIGEHTIVDDRGKECTFKLKHVAFHPDRHLDEYLQVEDGKIVKYGL